ncbi:MAG: hypothetical protein ACK4JX_06485 [Flavobacterium sp.]
MSLYNTLAKNYINFRGWKTNRKIVVIESDDWGSIRMPSKEIVDELKIKYPLSNNKFTTLDGLERKSDLTELFSLLKNYKDLNNNHPVITACSLVANPDFKKIEESKFTNYFYKTIEETYKDYGETELLGIWKDQGIKENLLYPQFHGREHLNPIKWLKILQSGNNMELDAFHKKCLLGLSNAMTAPKDLYMAAFDANLDLEKEFVIKSTIDGLKIFKEIFGFNSISFVPSQSKQFEEINQTLVENGVKCSQAGQYFVPKGDGTFKKVDKFWGDKDRYGMTFWRRNCNFEPFKDNSNELEKCLSEIDIAFRWGKPAIISFHRINFTSRIEKTHRDKCLDKFDKLLLKIIKKHPDVEFINSAQLAEIMLKSK